MGIRTYDLEPGDRWYAPANFDWRDDSVDWVIFRVVSNIDDGSCSHVTVDLDGVISTHRLDREIGICLVEGDS